jgi:hypothetical protein
MKIVQPILITVVIFFFAAIIDGCTFSIVPEPIAHAKLWRAEYCGWLQGSI